MFRRPAPSMRQLERFIAVFLLFATIAVGGALWIGSVSNDNGAVISAPSANTSIETKPGGAFVGAPAPDFSIALFDTGEAITLSKLRGQPVILDFFASWCSSCRAEAPSLRQFWEAYAERGIVLLGLALNDTAEGVQAFREEFRLTYPMGLVETGDIPALYRVGGIPTFVFIDREGRIAKVIAGTMSAEAMAAEAEALLK